MSARARRARRSSTPTRIVRTEEGENGEDEERAIPFLKAYTVFNIEQIDGLPGALLRDSPNAEPNPDERIAHAEAFFAATGADIRHGGDSAFYVPSLDYIQMPPFEAFRDAQGYYATLAHECTHWTRHADPRLTAISGASASAMKAMPAKSWSPSWARRSCAPISGCGSKTATTTPPISAPG